MQTMIHGPRARERGWAVRFLLANTICVALAVAACGSDEPLVTGSDGGAPPPPASTERRHLILVIGDGMHLEHEIAASRYLTGMDYGLVFHAFPYQNAMTTWDINTYDQYALSQGAEPYDPRDFDPRLGYDPDRGGIAPYPLAQVPNDDYFLTPLPIAEGSDTVRVPATDSAAAGTAMSTGYKTTRSRVAWTPGDSPQGALPTIAEQARAQRGMAIGGVTTVPFSHATPATFFSHQPERYLYQAIAAEMVSRTRPDVVIGGGHPGFGPAFQFLSADTYGELLSSPDWVCVERRPGHAAGPALRAATDLAVKERRGLFGLFGGDDGGFEPQRPADSPGAPRFEPGSDENPTTAEAMVAALEVLAQNDRGFFLMLEQGDIDWANHRNDFSWMIGAMASMDEAVRAAAAFVDRPGDSVDWSNTLLIVTSDHGNGYLRLSTEQPLGKGELPDDWAAHATYSLGDHTNELVMVYAKGGGLSDADHGPFAAVEGAFYEELDLIDNTHLCSAMAQFLGIIAR